MSSSSEAESVSAIKFTPSEHHDTYAAIAQADNRGKTVLVSGASKGIGRAIANAYGRSGAANIIIAARSDLAEVEQEIIASAASGPQSPKPKIVKLQLDITSEESVNKALALVEEKFDSLDVLINNGGYLERWMAVAESDPTEWWKSWEVNTKGVYLMTRAFLPLLLKSPTKTVINVSSVGAHFVVPGASAYQGNKFALLRFTEFIATEYKDQGIVAISIHPGGVATELALNMPGYMHTVLVDTPQLAADTVSWLTEERREWLSGRYISATWDMPELFAKREEIINGDKLKMRMVI